MESVFYHADNRNHDRLCTSESRLVSLILTARAQKKVYLMINNLGWIKWNEVSVQSPWVF